jgi:hypothetical protein
VKLIARRSCRICGSHALSPAISLGEQYIASNFATSKDFRSVERKIPLEVVRCDPELDEKACGFVQLRHSVPPNLMYSVYGYRSGINATMTRHLESIAASLEAKVPLAPGDVVVDVGANDGTLLRGYSAPGLRLIGFEPSNVAPHEKDLPPSWTIVRDYFSGAALGRLLSGGKVRIFTSIAMFYDLEDPDAFVADIASSLAADGVWVLELSYLPMMLEQNSFDTICHEHLGYYSLTVLEPLLQRRGLKVLDVTTSEINGGSFRVWVGHAGTDHSLQTSESALRVHAMHQREFELCLDTPTPFRHFQRDIETIRSNLRKLLLRLKAEGKTIYGYGASTKGNVILQFCELTPRILTAIADRNPAKWGTRTLGTDIPIVSEEEMREAKPDFLLILPWHFLPEFAEREARFLNRGGKFILPLPDVRVIPA